MRFILIIIVAGIIGFTLAAIVLVLPSFKSPFFELTIKDKKTKVDSLLASRALYIKRQVDTLTLQIKDNQSINDPKPINSIMPKIKMLEDLKKKSDEQYAEVMKERNMINIFNLDRDTLYYSKYFSIDRAHFLKLFNSDPFNADLVKFKLIDPYFISDIHYSNLNTKTAGLERKIYNNKIEYIYKYPKFGYWIVLSIAQMCMWFLIASIIILLNYKTLEELKLSNIKHRIKIIEYLLLVVFVMAIFLFVTYFLLIDTFVLDDHIFIKWFSIKMYIFAAIGYFVASICFFIYILMADQAHQLNIPSAPSPSALFDKLETLKTTFNYSFTFSALILSVFIVWLGSMFNAINSLELMDYYRQISGKYYLDNNYVYLIGFLHSLLLVIFYVPVQLKFNSLNLVKQQQASLTTDTPPNSKVLFGIFNSFSSILITVSPFLTSILQNIVSTYLNK